MTHWTDGPIAALDFETTGVDVETDRIVTYCVGLQNEHGWHKLGSIVDPGIPIPQTASDIHGVTNDRAEAEGVRPRAAVRRIHRALQAAWERGAPVVVYNAPFDLTMLDREMRRHLGRPFEVRGPVIDPLVLDKAVDMYLAHLKTCASKRDGDCDCGNSRRLSDTCKRYGVTLSEEDAHSASGDARAALELAVKVVRRGVMPVNGEKGDMSGKPLVEMTLGELYRAQRGAYQEQRQSFNAWLARKGKSLDSDNLVWPMAPYNGEV